MTRDPLPRRLVLQALAVVFASGCEDAQIAPPRVPPTPEAHTVEQQMFAMVNRDRAARGKPPLAYDESLADVARAHAADMHQHRFFGHESPSTGSLDDRLSRARISVVTARENLAEAVNVDEAEKSLIASPGHFANLMADDVTHVGVGVVAGGVEHAEMMLFVQVFARTVIQEKPEQARKIVIEKITQARAARGLPPPKSNALLDELANKYVGSIADAMDAGSLESVGGRVIDDLKARNAGNISVLVSGQRMVAASEYEPSQAIVEKPAIEIGVGAAPAKDDKGRPAVKILVLVGG